MRLSALYIVKNRIQHVVDLEVLQNCHLYVARRDMQNRILFVRCIWVSRAVFCGYFGETVVSGRRMSSDQNVLEKLP